ncbi:unnamed protein product [Rotaria sp. Silwood1]|nr:unnamed protein product [Rotaria sp. Silwood1]
MLVFEVVWEKLLNKIEHPEKYVQGISHVEILKNESDNLLRIIHFENDKWESIKIINCETINISRSTTNQVFQSELEYEINSK